MTTPRLLATAIIDMPAEGHGDRSVYRTEGDRLSAGRFGMVLFLGSLAMLFGATILGILAIRLDDTAWPRDLPPLPGAIWISTGLLLLSSVTMQWSVLAARRDSISQVRLALGLTLLLGLGFLVSQAVAWFAWNDSIQVLIDQDEAAGLASTGFHVLTGIHALHVLGGLVPLGIITGLVVCAAWRPARARGIDYTAMYWHFMDVVWITLVITLLLVL